MALAAKAWREHKQSGGHFARKDGTVSESEKKKYKHTHEGLGGSFWGDVWNVTKDVSQELAHGVEALNFILRRLAQRRSI